MRWKTIFRKLKKVVLSFLLSSLFFSPVILDFGENASAFNLRDRIYIDGNENFTAANGVLSGNGTWDDPYVISGWEITTFTANGIQIANTTAHFVINESYLHSDTNSMFDGIFLSNVSNGTVLRVNASENRYAIHLFNCSNITVSNSDFFRNGQGVILHEYSVNSTLTHNNFTLNGGYVLEAQRSSNISFLSNVLRDIDRGVSLLYSRDVNLSYNTEFELYFDHATNATVFWNNFTISPFAYAVRMINSEQVNISFNNISGSGMYSHSYAIHMEDCRFIDIFSNDLSENKQALFLQSCADVTIVNNTISSSVYYGIYSYLSTNMTIARNEISDNTRQAVYLHSCTRVLIIDNNFTDGGVFLVGYDLPHFNSHQISNDNRVNGNPLYYYKNCSDIDLDGVSVGQLLFANCTNVRAANLEIQKADIGIQMAFVENALVERSNLSANWYGLYADYSTNITARDNDVLSNSAYGIYFPSSENITIAGNNVSLSGREGIRLFGCENATVRDNHMHGNVRDGIILIQCTDALLTRNDISRSDFGIYLSSSSDVAVSGNTVRENGNATYLLDSTNVSIVWNDVLRNGRGIYLGMSSGNFVNHNNITENTIQAVDYTIGGNRWDDGYPSGGNYWSDYVGSDNFSGPNQDQPGSDGMGDTPYDIDMDSVDRYPLIVPRHDFNPPRIVQTFINGKETQTYSIESIPELNLTATIDDRDTGSSWIGGANHTLGLSNWSSSNVMSAQDGAFDSDWEDVFANLSPPTEVGSYSYCVYAWDIQGNLNATSTACPELNILSPPLRPLIVSAVLSGPNLEDVTVSWNRSGDDGTGENDIERYDIYRSTSYTGPYELVANVTANGSLVYEWTCSGCGKANPNSYFFHVEAYDGVLSSASPRKAAKFTRTLSQGPNLVSIPFAQFNDSTEYVLQTVEYDKVWYYDASSQEWKSYVRFKSYGGDLRHVNHTMGIWINVTEDCNLTVAGVVPAQTMIHLYEGWNLVSFPSFNSSYGVVDLKADTGAIRVEGFHSLPPHYLRILGDMEVLQAGYGYWVRVETYVVWTVGIE